MAELILHHYPESLFSEKARAMLNALQLPWRSVIIPMVMPRPDTIPLTGGYRRTPVMQVGADVYCDTAMIALYLDTHLDTHLEGRGSGPTLFPAASRLAAQTLARWVDTELFWASVTLRFQPSNMGSFFASSEAATAFAADRANFSQGATIRQLPIQEALPRYQTFLAELDAQLSDGRRYLFGSEWTIADFSVYHVVWFVHAGGGMADLLAKHASVKAWYERMNVFGANPGQHMSGADALQVAQQSTPVPINGSSDIAELPLGTMVDVGPTDYGVMPSRGELLNCDTHSIVIRRQHERSGVVHVHFPRHGFGARKADS